MTARRTVIHWRGGHPVKSYFEAARPDKTRKQRRESGSGDLAVERAGLSLREQARHLEQNHDLARGTLGTLVQNTVGHTGIQVESQPKATGGGIHKEFAAMIRDQWKAWCKKPEVTYQHSWASSQRLMARAWFRDGEGLIQHLAGRVAKLQHASEVPYSIEMIEADYLPMDYSSDSDPRIIQGVEKNAWGRPVAYHLYKEHPNDVLYFRGSNEMKRVAADRIEHIKLLDRIGQTRGVTTFASVLLRLDDIKDYEQSERIAAKVAASMAGYIKKGSPDDYAEELDEDGDPVPRQLRFRPGMIFDNLAPGEDIGTIDTKRPNSNLEAFRNSQLKAIAAGVGVTFSSIARTYDGTFSAQRQELIEGWGAYATLAAEFSDQMIRPVYERWLTTAILTRTIEMPGDVDMTTIMDAVYVAPEMPWIDPLKEAQGWQALVDMHAASTPEIIRKRGKNPEDVLEQQAAWNEALEERGLTQSTEQQSLNFEPIDDEEDEDARNRA